MGEQVHHVETAGQDQGGGVCDQGDWSQRSEGTIGGDERVEAGEEGCKEGVQACRTWQDEAEVAPHHRKDAEMARKKKCRWVAESQDGRFVIECRNDGCLIVVDCDHMNPNDDDSMDGIICIQPNDAEVFLTVMKAALDLHGARVAAKEKARAARIQSKEKTPAVPAVKKSGKGRRPAK